MTREKYFMDEFKRLPWSEVRRSLEAIGWITKKDDTKAKVFAKGMQRLSILRMDRDKWKVEFFWGRHLDDSMGINDTDSAKILALEFGMLKGVRRGQIG